MDNRHWVRTVAAIQALDVVQGAYHCPRCLKLYRQARSTLPQYKFTPPQQNIGAQGAARTSSLPHGQRQRLRSLASLPARDMAASQHRGRPGLKRAWRKPTTQAGPPPYSKPPDTRKERLQTCTMEERMCKTHRFTTWRPMSMTRSRRSACPRTTSCASWRPPKGAALRGASPGWRVLEGLQTEARHGGSDEPTWFPPR